MKGKRDVPEMSNADLKRMLDQTMIRFENWRVEVERKPNPMMIHSLKNIMSIIETVTSMADRRIEYSYKALVTRMAELMHETAELNMTIVNSLQGDDSIDEDELKLVSSRLFTLINAAAELARLVQEHFGSPELTAATGRNLLPEPGDDTAQTKRR
ncbi:MAG TPA: hypothetical protein PLQ29_08635 [Spirochaetales bacterium]|nr:hypothetical protein [Spirochaetales bacterium]HPG86752.1 hypothetical protein [Spirochaetales bacterium]HPM72653.1 hypothetical protein [Spirochaetales bacterium]